MKSNKLIKIYLIVIASLITWSSIAYFTMAEQLSNQDKYATLINKSGKQRMLSKKLALLSYEYLNGYKSLDNKDLIIKELEENKVFLLENITSLRINNIYYSEPYNLKVNLENYLSKVEKFFINPNIEDYDDINSISSRLIEKLDFAVKEYELESKSKSEELIKREFYILLATILTILLESMFLIFPMIRNINQYEKKLEQQLVEKEDSMKEIKRLSAIKSDFLSNMSHEIRTPLNGIIGVTDIVLSDETNPKKLKYLNVIKNSSTILKNILNDILDISKIEAGKFSIYKKPFDLEVVFHDMENLFKPQIISKNIDFKVNIKEDVCTNIIGDDLRISQVISNLLSNAIKFTHEGSIILEVQNLEQKENIVKLRFSIQDTGIGMSDEIKSKIFENFTQGELSNTKHYQGTGLGLSISKSIVELMNGNIDFESKEGLGTKFYFDLTFEKSNEIKREIKEKESSTNLPKEKARILVAEDEYVNQMVIGSVLKKFGLMHEFANDGEEVIQKLKENSDLNIILMDIQMPILDGFETTKKIREFNTDIPIIALSASVLEEDKEKCELAGMNGHLSKPINKEEIYKEFSKYFKL